MIIDDFNVKWAVLSPHKAESKLIVDADAILPLPVAFQRFQPVAGRGTKKIQRLGCIQLGQFANRTVFK